MAEEGRRGKQNSRERKIKDNSWVFCFKWFRLSEGSWKRSRFGGKEIKNSGLVISSTLIKHLCGEVN